jgi:hypothetical protein
MGRGCGCGCCLRLRLLLAAAGRPVQLHGSAAHPSTSRLVEARLARRRRAPWRDVPLVDWTQRPRRLLPPPTPRNLRVRSSSRRRRRPRPRRTHLCSASVNHAPQHQGDNRLASALPFDGTFVACVAAAVEAAVRRRHKPSWTPPVWWWLSWRGGADAAVPPPFCLRRKNARARESREGCATHGCPTQDPDGSLGFGRRAGVVRSSLPHTMDGWMVR